MSHFKTLNRQFVSNLQVNEFVTKAKRDLILSILKSTTTKREARNYLAKYQSQFNFGDVSFGNDTNVPSLTKRDRQRELFVNRFLEGRNPFINIYESEETKLTKIPLRIAIIKLVASDGSSDYYKGIAETFRRLVDLGISPVVIMDHGDVAKESFKMESLYSTGLAQKLLQVLSDLAHNEHASIESTISKSLFVLENGEVSISSLEQLLIPLYQGIIPIVLPVLYDSSTTCQRFFNPNSALYHLCSMLLDTNDLLSVEKVVIIDKLGGIPSIERDQTSHVFINLSQEFSDIVSELYIGYIEHDKRDKHLSNLNVMNDILSIASEKSQSNDTTGIITTPEIMSVNNDQLNPILYNVLTDRPIISSSLPSSAKRTPQVSTSIIKKGFPVIVIDEHSYTGEFTFLNLVRDKLVDQHKLFSLIEDSFGRELNTEDYLARIERSLSTVIVVGDYDGAAIITWENLPNGDRIAYLDKFAIAKKNQGLPSLADIIFKLISQSHQSELFWRSRKNNPVNKWYFERCRGSIAVPNSPWKLFYTGSLYNNRMGTKIDGSEQTSIDIARKLEMYSYVVNQLKPSFR